MTTTEKAAIKKYQQYLQDIQQMKLLAINKYREKRK